MLFRSGVLYMLQTRNGKRTAKAALKVAVDLAAEGVMLTQGYANSAVCTPSRVALITGRYQHRLAIGREEPLERCDAPQGHKGGEDQKGRPGAHHLTARPYRAMALSVAIAVLSVWAGLVVSYALPDVPPSFGILAVATGAFLLARLRRSAA